MPMRIQADTLRSEVKQVLEILNKWDARLGEGVPGDDMPADDLSQEVFQVQVRGEMQLCAERLMAIVEVLE